jgi:hypothetical protein
MKQKELELLVSLGKVASIDVRRPQGAAGWLVICQCEGYVPGALAPELETSRGEARIFSSLDAACRTLEAIGVTTFQVFTK